MTDGQEHAQRRQRASKRRWRRLRGGQRAWLTVLRRALERRFGASEAAPDARLDLLDWARRMLPTHFRLPPSAMHRWLAEELTQAERARGAKINCVGPRGGAKSTVGTLAYVLRAVVEAREPYVWIISDTRHQAVAHLENVRAELLENERLRAAYTGACGRGPVWQSSRLVLPTGVTLEAFGTGQRIRGRRRREHRPTLIVCDDLQNDQHIDSARARDRSRQWFHGTLLRAGTRRTNVLNLATALHRDALAMELTRAPGWRSRVFRALERWPDSSQLWLEWEAIYSDLERPDRVCEARRFYDAHRAAMDRGAVLLWPEEEDLLTLMQWRAESGRTAFEREKQGSPLDPSACEWPESYFGDELWFDEWPSELRLRVLALDPSKGRDARRGDYSAFVLLGVDAEGRCWVEADLARRPTPQIVEEGVELVRRHRPDAFGVESNAYQELLGAELGAALRRANLMTTRPWTLDNHVSKLVRIRRLGPYLAQRRLRFLRGSVGTRLLLEQLRDFPLGEHDDGPDALEMAIRLAAELLARPAADDGLRERLVWGS